MHERYISFNTTALASGIVENGGAKNGVRSNAPQQLNAALHINGLPYCTCKTKHIPNKLIYKLHKKRMAISVLLKLQGFHS